MSVQTARWAHRTISSVSTSTTSRVVHTQRFVGLRSNRRVSKLNSREYGVISTPSGFADFGTESTRSSTSGAPTGKDRAATQYINDEKKEVVESSSHVRATDTEHSRRDKLLEILGGLPVDVNGKLVNLEYGKRLRSAVEDGQADLAVRCLLVAAKQGDMDFIRDISNTTFTKMLKLLEPYRTVSKLAASHRHISPQQQATLKTTPVDVAAHHHYKILRTIFRLRRMAGAELTLEQYALLLRSARDLGKSGFAYALFKNLTQAGHAMTTECWNYLMEAVLLSGQHRPEARQSYRIIPRNLEGRAEAVRHRRFLNYRVGEAKGGLKATISGLFDLMCDAGATADQATYRTLLIAAGREGDMNSVAAILKSAWGIQVDYLDGKAKNVPEFRFDASQSTSVADDFDSRTLHAIVHVFLINNNIPLALRALESMSQKLNITGKSRIWEEILEYTMAFAKPRSGRGKESSGDKADELSLSSVTQVLEAFKSVSGDVIPTMSMYKHMIKALYYARVPGEMLKVIAQSLTTFAREGKSLRNDEERLLHHPPDIPKHLDALRSRWERQQLEHRAHANWIRRAVLLLLDTTGRAVDVEGEMTLRQLPKAIISLRSWMPYRVSYEVIGGLVEFDLKPSSAHESLRNYKANRAAVVEKIMNNPPRLFAPHRHTRLSSSTVA